ncbi:MAG: glycerol-3-phosphate acyltransferase, partial [Clostridia bacterium]|nr:glycerol-3-phosphate acyltransferase [Clostridia bacterium]
MVYWQLAIVLVVSYFVGNINFARIISRHKNIDITIQSSGNPGATNMYRTFGPKLGYLTLLLDAIKGIIAACLGLFVLGHSYFPPDADGLTGLYVCGLAAMVGHCFPVIYGFKGGKGVS